MKFKHQKTNDILNWFEKISAIPRCSKNEYAICQWLISWAKDNNFETKTDKSNNILIKVPASQGSENAPIIILQGHLDMVCEKTPESNHDFTKDPIKLIYDETWISADKTSLGADNGIAIAFAMALALDKEIYHPPLELLFTVDEETGLHGANALEAGFFEGRILINIDSEDEGHLTIGCAGGLNSHLSLPIEWTTVPQSQLININIGGLKGGHSGVDIHTERANAIKVLARTLSIIQKKVNINIANISGGTAHNAIPRNAKALVCVASQHIETVKSLVQDIETGFKSEYKNTDSDLFIKVDTRLEKAKISENTQQIIDFLIALPHGVATMSNSTKVESSNNLAQVSIENGQLKVLTSQRSSVESRLEALTNKVEAVTRLVGGTIYHDTHYPAWQPNIASPLLAQSQKTYENLFEGQKPVVEVMHAGLECGIIGNKVSGMDMISIGPTIKSPHSPNEKIHIDSIGRVWDFLIALLQKK